MAYFERTSVWKSIMYSRGMALAVLVFVAFVGYGAASIAVKSAGAAKERRIAEQDARDLEFKQADLERKLALLATPEGKEAALRDQFPVVRPGEGVVMITEGEAAGAAPATAGAAPENASGGFWHFLKNLFK